MAEKRLGALIKEHREDLIEPVAPRCLEKSSRVALPGTDRHHTRSVRPSVTLAIPVAFLALM